MKIYGFYDHTFPEDSSTWIDKNDKEIQVTHVICEKTLDEAILRLRRTSQVLEYAFSVGHLRYVGELKMMKSDDL